MVMLHELALASHMRTFDGMLSSLSVNPNDFVRLMLLYSPYGNMKIEVTELWPAYGAFSDKWLSQVVHGWVVPPSIINRGRC